MTKQNLTQQIIDYIQAGYTAFYLKTTELARADRLISEVANQLRFNVIEYNLAYGRVKFENKESIDDSLTSFEKIFNHLRHEDLENNLILIKDAKLGLENNSVALARLKYLLDQLNFYKGECAVILQSADVYLPNEIEPLVTLLELPLPDQNQIQAVLKQEKIANELTDRLITALSGLNELDIQQLLNLLKNKYGELTVENEKVILAEIQQQKEQIIAKSGVLEMVKVNEEIEDIGGLEKLKAWLQDQSYIVKNLQAAKEFGVKAPKGTLIAGMPGCGKSLTAKAAAALFQQPLLRLDIGSLLGKYVGESETNMRKALAMAESISPCVLWVDELEKAFVGMTGNNASEVSSRLLGYFLTWLQEKTAPVFIIATANDITALPPELLRKGRFDEIFYVGFPTKKERKKIIEIHLAKAKQDASQFDIEALAKECRDYAGADIENAIFEAVKKAFIQQGKLTQDLLLEAIRNTTPLRKTLKDKVGEYEKKFDELYLSPASENDGLSIAQMQKMAKDPNYLIRLKVAEDENVTEEILEQLAKDDEFEVCEAVFKNPLCPTKLLDEQLSLDEDHKDYDEDLLDIIYQHKNTSFALALSYWKDGDKKSRIDDLFKNNKIDLLENQEAILEYGKDYSKLLLCKANTRLSAKVRQHLFNNKSIRDGFCGRDDLTIGEFQILVRSSENLKELVSNDKLKERYYEILADEVIRYSGVQFDLTNSNLSEAGKQRLDVFIKFFSSSYITESIQLKLVDCVLRGIFAYLYTSILFSTSTLYDATISRLLDYSGSDKFNIYTSLASYEGLSEQTQLKLVEIGTHGVLLALVRNKNLSSFVASFIVSSHSNEDIQVFLCERNDLSGTTQEKLAKSKNWRVRLALARNKKLLHKTQKILMNDVEKVVRMALKDNSSIPQSIRDKIVL